MWTFVKSLQLYAGLALCVLAQRIVCAQESFEMYQLPTQSQSTSFESNDTCDIFAGKVSKLFIDHAYDPYRYALGKDKNGGKALEMSFSFATRFNLSQSKAISIDQTVYAPGVVVLGLHYLANKCGVDEWLSESPDSLIPEFGRIDQVFDTWLQHTVTQMQPTTVEKVAYDELQGMKGHKVESPLVGQLIEPASFGRAHFSKGEYCVIQPYRGVTAIGSPGENDTLLQIRGCSPPPNCDNCKTVCLHSCDSKGYYRGSEDKDQTIFLGSRGIWYFYNDVLMRIDQYRIQRVGICPDKSKVIVSNVNLMHDVINTKDARTLYNQEVDKPAIVDSLGVDKRLDSLHKSSKSQ
jgi:hypothetical protein